MRTLTTLMATVAVATLFAGSPLVASAQTAPDPHHPADEAGAQPAASDAQPATMPASGNQPGMTGTPSAQPPAMMGNMPMMATMMTMMNMMGMTGQGGAGMAAMASCEPGMAGVAAIDHIAGRIAFLRAELAITEAQAGAWNAFSDALRTNAEKLAALRGAMMPQAAGTGSPQAATPMQRLALEERRLAAQLDGVRAIKPAFEALYAALSADQKKTADELLTSPMGPMAMMPLGGSPQ